MKSLGWEGHVCLLCSPGVTKSHNTVIARVGARTRHQPSWWGLIPLLTHPHLVASGTHRVTCPPAGTVPSPRGWAPVLARVHLSEVVAKKYPEKHICVSQKHQSHVGWKSPYSDFPALKWAGLVSWLCHLIPYLIWVGSLSSLPLIRPTVKQEQQLAHCKGLGERGRG